ncbi:chromosome segregation protein [Clostridiales bacterium CHKCI001]|nr:chromosome segregation protein [Clostridiales bacterium CHKCI001]
MATDIGPRIGIKGEAEFNRAINNINNSLKELGSEMKVLESTFDGNARSQEELSTKGELLSRQYELQKAKLNELVAQHEKQENELSSVTKALEEARQKFGENSKEAAKAETVYNKQVQTVSKLKIAVNEMTATLNKTGTDIRKNNESLELLNNTAQGFDVSKIDNAMKKLSNSQAEEAIKNTDRAIESLEKQLERLREKTIDSSGKLSDFVKKNELLGQVQTEQKQKIAIIADEYEKQKRNLEQLSNVLQEAKEKTGNSSEASKRAEEAYEAQASAVKELEDSLKNANAALQDTTTEMSETAENINNIKFEKISQGAETVGKVTGVAMGAAGAAIGVASKSVLDFTSDYQNANKIIWSQTGITSGKFVELSVAAREVFADNFGESLTEVAENIAEINRQTGETDPSKLKELAEGAYTLRDAYGAEIPESMRAVNQLMNQFGLSATEAFNLIVQGYQRGLDKNGNFLDSLNEYGPKYAQLGLSAEEMFNSLAAGAEGGVFDIDKLGDAMNEFTIRVKDSDADEAMIALGLATEDVSEQLQGAQGNVQTYQEKVQDLEQKLGLAQLKQSEFNDKTKESTKIQSANTIAKYSKELEEARQKLAEASTEVSNLTEKQNAGGISLDEFKRKFAEGGETGREAFLQLVAALKQVEDPLEQNKLGVQLFGSMWEDTGGTAILAMTDIQGEIDRTNNAMAELQGTQYNSSLSDTFSSMGRQLKLSVIEPISMDLLPLFQQLAGKAKEAFNSPEMQSSLANLRESLGEVIEKITNFVVDHMPQITNAISVLLSNLDKLPPVLGVIGGLFATVKIVQFGKSVINTFQSVANVFSFLASNVDKIKVVLAGLKGVVTGVFSVIQAHPVIAAITAIIGIVVLLYNKCEWFRDGVNAVLSKVKETFGNAIEGIKNFLSGFPEWWNGIWSSVSEFFSSTWEKIVEFFTVTIPDAWNTTKEFFAGIPEWWNGIWSNVGEFFSSTWEKIVEFFTVTIPDAWNTTKEFFAGIPEWWNGIWSNVGEFFSSTWEKIVEFFTVTIPDAWNITKEFFAGIPEWWNGIWSSLKENFSNIWNTMLENPIIKTIVNNIKADFELLKENLSIIWQTIQTVAGNAWELIKNIILAPVLLLIDLVTGDFNKLKEDAANIWNNIKEAALNIWNALKEAVAQIVINFVENIKEKLNNLKQGATEAWENIKANAAQAWENIKNTVIQITLNFVEGIKEKINNLKQSAAEAWENIKANAAQTWENIKTSVVNKANELWQGAKEKFESLKTFLWELLPNILNFLSEKWNEIKKNVSDKIEEMKTNAINTFNNMKQSISEKIDSIKSTIVKGIQEAVDFITSLPGKAVQWGRDFIDGLKKGVEERVNGIIDAVKGIGDKIRSFLHFSRPDEGPLREYEKWMPDFMSGLGKGIKNNTWRVIDPIKNLSDQMSLQMQGMDFKLSEGIVESAYNAGYEQIIEVHTVTNLDGKVIGNTVTPVVVENISRQQRSKSKVRGGKI